MSAYLQGLAWRAALPDYADKTPVKAALARLADNCDDKGRCLFPIALAELARDISASKTTTRTALNRLARLGVITLPAAPCGGPRAIPIHVHTLLNLRASAPPPPKRSGHIQ